MVSSYQSFNRIIKIALLALCITKSFAQKNEKPYKGGFVSKSLVELKGNYDEFWRQFDVKKGERVASIGAQNGYIEVAISIFVDSVHWTIQDIDTTYLNAKNFNNVVQFHEKLKGSKIIADFALVIGEKNKTNLSKNSFDRIIMSNVYHEISDRESIMADIETALKRNGELVVMERMASKRGKKHGDCKKPELWEPDFLNEMESFKFKLVNKVVPSKKYAITFYTFNKV